MQKHPVGTIIDNRDFRQNYSAFDPMGQPQRSAFVVVYWNGSQYHAVVVSAPPPQAGIDPIPVVMERVCSDPNPGGIGMVQRVVAVFDAGQHQAIWIGDRWNGRTVLMSELPFLR